MDIKELMRTYVFINDPDVKQVSTKFGGLVLVLGAVAGLAWVAAGLVSEEAAPGDEAGTAAASYEEESCMPAAELEGWLAEHEAIVDAGTYDVTWVEPDRVCVAYDTV